jgi:prepilin-type processing-associated H-X9-DG protein
MRRALFLGLSLAWSGASAQVITKQPDMSIVLTAERALMVLDPRLVAPGNVYGVSASPSGRYLVALQEVPSERPLELGKQPPEPRTKNFVIWDSATGASRSTQIHLDVDARRSQVQWFKGTDKALLLLHSFRVEARRPEDGPGPMISQHREWHVLDAASGQLRKVLDEREETVSLSGFAMSPVAPIAVTLNSTSDPSIRKEDRDYYAERSIAVLHPDGRWERAIKLDASYRGYGATGWSEDGRTFQLEVGKEQKGERQLAPRVLQFDLVRGTYSEVVGPVPSWTEKEVRRDARIVAEQTSLEDNPIPRVAVTWWLRSVTGTEAPQALVAEHATSAILANGDRFVAYVVGGALFTRQVVQIPVAEFLRMREAAKRAVLISNAKQVALAALMYATDYDDVLPPDLDREKLGPYARNDSIFDGFVYVFAGGDLSKVADPASTVLGYIEGPGGRAVAFVDGHVEWKEN